MGIPRLRIKRRNVVKELENIKVETRTQMTHNKTRTECDKSKVDRSTQHNKLRIMCANCRSICNKTSELEVCIHDVTPDIVIGSESWLSKEIKTSEIFPPGYQQNVYRKDRNRHGGGVFIAAQNTVTMWEVKGNHPNCELLWTELKTRNKNVIIGSAYRPPNSDVTFLDQLQASLSQILTTCKEKIVILGGDFNFPHIDWDLWKVKTGADEAKQHRAFLDIMEEAGLHQVQMNMTRNDNNLDLVFTNFPSLITTCHTAPGLSDHDIVIIDVATKINHNKTKPRRVFKFKTAEWGTIKTEMDNLARLITDMNGSVENRWQTLKRGINDIMNRNVLSKMTTEKHTLPWINGALKRKIKLKHKLYQHTKRLKTIESQRKFKEFKSQLQKDIRNAHLDYINKTLNESLGKGNNKNFWKYIKAKRRDNIGVSSLEKNGALQHDSKSKANILNNQFKSVFTREDHETDLPAMMTPAYPSIPDLKITVEGIAKLLSQIDTSKATGPDNIPNVMLKMCAMELAPAITSLFQESIDTGNLPDDWRNANVSPVYKKGSRHLASNYRPVSLTSVCCKMLEHIICRHMLIHLENHNIITPLQHGFRSGHSCETQLVITIDDIMKRHDKKEQVDLAILDFSKAFDTVPHRRLLHKLEKYGITGNIFNWIKSFLTQRQQQVLVEGEVSTPCKVESGVPQGTVLGPLLFLCHINDLPENISSQVRLFADDCLLYRSVTSPKDHEILQDDLTSLQKWAHTWGMKFNETKCYIMSIHRRKTPSHFSYSLNDHPLENVHENPYLGIQISDNLKWSSHIDKIHNRASSVLGVIRRNLKNCPKVFKEQAYISLVRPILEYGCIIWDPHTRKNIVHLESIQRRAARFVSNDYGHQSSVTKMMKRLNWRPLNERRRDHRLAFFHKVIIEQVAVPQNQLQLKSRPQRHAKNTMQLKEPFADTEVYRQSFFPRTIRDWNGLPQTIVSCASSELFKNTLSDFAEISG